jgi:immune inhibitor A
LNNLLVRHFRKSAQKSGLAVSFAILMIAVVACQNDEQLDGDLVPTTVPSEISTSPVASEPTPESTTVQATSTIAPTSLPATPTIAVPVLKPTAQPTGTASPIPTSATPDTTVSPGGTGSSSGLNPTATPAPTSTPVPVATAVFVPALPGPDIPEPPDRDLQELGMRLVDGYTEVITTVEYEPLTLGQKLDFWVSRDAGSVLVSGEVSHISEHAYWIFENGYIPDPDDIQNVANKFESEVWPAVTEVFGTPLTPGIDGDERMVVYTAVLRSGVAGYFSAADSYPKEIRTYSNEREALYMSANRVDLTGNEFLSVIAHELQHATHFATDSSEDSWVNEGLSEIAAEIAGFVRSAASAFVRAPSTSLTAWAQEITVSAANYGAANLFFAFLATHYGGNEMMAAVAANRKDGIDSIDDALAKQGFDVTATDVYADWLVANYMSTFDGPYSYANRKVPPVRNIYKRAPDSLTGSVKSFGADYFVTSSPSGQMTVEFTGEAETTLLIDKPHSGDTCWWSNHGDSIDSTLTRSIDLRSVDSATFKFWTNYEIEEFWDYAYVMISNDDGASWNIVDTGRAIYFDPNGNSYGPGLTGTSLGWVQDSVDISAYAGQQVLLRIEYITDDAVFSHGACFDDLEIPEIDWFDDTSTNGGWVANGFVRVEHTVPTQYLVQVIHEKDSGEPDVYKIPIGADGKGSVTVDNVGDDDLIVAIVSAITRQSTNPTNYTLSIKP